MNKERVCAFSDGVIAILITIMVLELKTPKETDWSALRELGPTFFAYVLSFVFVGIYWNNHHHMLQLVDRINGGILWANMHLLFWLSLIPFVTSWLGEHGAATVPAAVYGIVMLGAGIAYYTLQQFIIAEQGPGSKLRAAVGRDFKGNASPVFYLVAIGAAFVSPIIAEVIYVAVALMWLIPDRRIERAHQNQS